MNMLHDHNQAKIRDQTVRHFKILQSNNNKRTANKSVPPAARNRDQSQTSIVTNTYQSAISLAESTVVGPVDPDKEFLVSFKQRQLDT